MGVKIREKVKGSGVFWVFINHKNRRTSKKVGRRQNASKVAEQIEAQLKLGQSPIHETSPATPTLGEYYQRFSQTYLETVVRANTKDMYETSFRRVLPLLENKRLDEITRTQITDVIASLVKRGLAKPTIRITMSQVSTLFNHAIEHGVIEANPVKNTSKYYKQAPVRHSEIQPLIAEEVTLSLRTIVEHSPAYYPLFLCAIHTGLRSGELAALQWGDVDFFGKFLVVRRTFSHGRMERTKNDKIHRVDLSTPLLDALRKLRGQRREDWLVKGENQIPDWVFCDRAGNPPDMQNVKNRHFLPCLRKAGLRRIRFHDLRHSFASLLIQNGESLAYVKEQLGHASIRMTVDVYGHLVPGANRDAMDRLPTLEDTPIGEQEDVTERQP